MNFYSIFISILKQLSPGKWVLLGQMVKGGSKYYDFFTGFQWTLIRILLINASIMDDNALSNCMVLCREGWDAFTSSHPSI